MLRAPLMLYMTAEPFEYPRSDWPGSVRLVGPGIWDPPAKSPAWLEEIERPLVLVTCSSEFQNDGKLVQVALEALAGEGVEVVVTTAGVDPSSFTPPPNARIERFVPHRAAPSRPRARGLRRLPRRHGHHPESARGGRACVRRAVRPGPVRCRPARRGRRRRRPAARLPAASGAF